MKSKVYLTLDVDWASEHVLEHVLTALQKNNVRATFFATHESQVLNSLESDSYEVGLHPNFHVDKDRIDSEALRTLKALYPNAIGTRSHCLFFSSRLIKECVDCGMEYESNIFLWRHLGLYPVLRSKELRSIPCNWSDDKHLEMGDAFNVKTFPNLLQDGLNVFNFHPIHLYLNSSTMNQYIKAKNERSKAGMEQHINHGEGVGTLFAQLCRKIHESSIDTGLMRELLSECP